MYLKDSANYMDYSIQSHQRSNGLAENREYQNTQDIIDAFLEKTGQRLDREIEIGQPTKRDLEVGCV